MPWQQDPNTGEWIMVDAPIADVRATDAGPHEGYDTGGARRGTFPVLPPEQAPQRDAEGIPSYYAEDMRPPPPGAGAYQNDDPSILDRWERACVERGNEVRTTGIGTFEVDPGGRIVSEAPLPHRVN